MEEKGGGKREREMGWPDCVKSRSAAALAQLSALSESAMLESTSIKCWHIHMVQFYTTRDDSKSITEELALSFASSFPLSLFRSHPIIDFVNAISTLSWLLS